MKGKENEEESKLAGRLPDDWIASHYKRAKKAKQNMKEGWRLIQETKEDLRISKQQRAEREAIRAQKDALEAKATTTGEQRASAHVVAPKAKRVADDKRVEKAKPDMEERRRDILEMQERLRSLKQQRKEREEEAQKDDKLVDKIIKDFEEEWRRQSPKKNEGQRTELQPNDFLAVGIEMIDKGIKDTLEDRGAKNAQNSGALHSKYEAEAKATKASDTQDEFKVSRLTVTTGAHNPVIPQEEDARMRQERLAYGMSEKDSVVAELELEALSETSSNISDNEDEFGRSTKRVVDDDVHKRVRELDEKLGVRLPAVREEKERLELRIVAKEAKLIEMPHPREEKKRRIQEKREAKRIAIETKKAERRELAAKKKAIQEKLAREIEEQRALKAKEDAEAKARKAAAARDSLLASKSMADRYEGQSC